MGQSMGLRTYKKQNKHHITDTSDVGNFVRIYGNELLWQEIGGRSHSAYPRFRHQNKIVDPGKFKARLAKYSTKLDVARYAQEGLID